MKQSELLLRLSKYTDRLGPHSEMASVMISLVVWNAIDDMGPENTAEWISHEVNESIKAVVKMRKKVGLPV